MCAAIIGGMTRLRRDYINAARNMGVDIKWFEGSERNVCSQLGGADMLLVFTGKVSHKARKQVAKHAKKNGIPLSMLHSSGVSTLKRHLAQNAAR